MMNPTSDSSSVVPPTVDDVFGDLPTTRTSGDPERGHHDNGTSSVELSTLKKSYFNDGSSGWEEPPPPQPQLEKHTYGIQPPVSSSSLPTPEEYIMDTGSFGAGRRRHHRRFKIGGEGGGAGGYCTTKMVWLATAGLCTLLLVLILGIALGVRSNNRPNNRATNHSRSNNEALVRQQIVDWIVHTGISSSTNVMTKGTPQYQAIDYMVNDASYTYQDPRKNDDQAAEYMVMAKYILAVLYYSTGGEQWFSSLRFLQPNTDICTWLSIRPAVSELGNLEVSAAGVLCNDTTGFPVGLDLELNNLVGPIPTELGLLTTLKVLDLEYNNITTFPPEICKLTELEWLLLGGDSTSNPIGGPLPNCVWPKLRNLRFKYNRFTGNIPTEYCTMHQLRALILDKNELKGNMLPCTGEDWPELTLLAFSDNLLTGTLPAEIASLPKLKQLFTDGNLLEGNPLATIAPLTNLEFLYLEENFFTGTIDETFCQDFINLRVLDISENNFTLANKQFPVHLLQLEKLAILDLSENQFAGALPINIPIQSNLLFFSIHKNQMTGTVPSSLTSLVALQHIDLANNEFTGPMTAEIFNMTSLFHIYLSENNFTEGFIPTMDEGMVRLREISLKNTNRIGPLPNFTGFNDLFMIDLDHNRLTGTVPANYGTRTSLRHLLLNRNPGLSGNLPTFSEPSNLGTVLLDKTGITGDFSSVCSLATIKGTQKIPTEVIVLADCDDSDAGIICDCCQCCSRDQEVCSDPIVTSLDWTWENGFNRAVRDFAINHTLFEDSPAVSPN